jgi:drug/metabolite transporter (DMT)-like permease
VTSRHLGELLSAVAPMAWAVAVVLFRAGGDRVGPVAMNLFKNMVALPLFAVTLLVMGQVTWADAQPGDATILLASGVIGIALADTLFFVALNALGASRLAVVGASYPVWVILLSVTFLGETFTLWQWVGCVLMVAAVVLATLPEGGVSRAAAGRGLAIGVVAGLASVLLMAGSIVMAKPVLDRAPVVWSSSVRLAGGTAVLLVYGLLSPARRTLFRPWIPGAQWRTILPASLVGTYLAYMLWLGGAKFAPVSIASVLNQLHVIYTAILAALFLSEKMTPRKGIAVALSIGGSALVVLN